MKKVNIYQIDSAKDKNKVKFMPYSFTIRDAGAVDSNIYKEVFHGEFSEDTDLEDLFEYFNTKPMAGLNGHSVSVSDVIEITENGETKCYFTDDIGFAEIPFDSSNLEKVTGFKCIAIPDCETDPYVTLIKDDMHAWQQATSGCFEVAYPFIDNAFVLCNEEGKFNGMEPNRDLGFDVIYGPFAILADNGEGGIKDLTDEQIDKYMNALLLENSDEWEFR